MPVKIPRISLDPHRHNGCSACLCPRYLAGGDTIRAKCPSACQCRRLGGTLLRQKKWLRYWPIWNRMASGLRPAR